MDGKHRGSIASGLLKNRVGGKRRFGPSSSPFGLDMERFGGSKMVKICVTGESRFILLLACQSRLGHRIVK